MEYGWLGVQIADVQSGDSFPGLAADLKLTGVKGAFVLDIFLGSPADAGGMLPGDYVTRVSATDIGDSNQLMTVVGGLVAGRTYDFRVLRLGSQRDLSVRIGLRDAADKVAQARNLWPGMTVVDLDDQIRQQADIPAGVVGVVVGAMSSQDAPTAVAGLRPGDVITAVDGRTVRNLMDYYRALDEKPGRPATFTVNRQGTEVSIGVSR